MKKEHYEDYSAEETARSESALLTVWAVLHDFTEDLVLVGGLVPRYICRPAADVAGIMPGRHGGHTGRNVGLYSP